jgi:hypothetical protein
MVDLCYLADLLCLVSALALPHSRALWRVNLALTTGRWRGPSWRGATSSCFTTSTESSAFGSTLYLRC